jgi:hypothetical protein
VRGWLELLGVAALALLLGCPAPSGSGGYRYFEPPDGSDPWSHPIARWQLREGGAPAGPGAAAAPAPLGDRYVEFLSARRRALAAEVASWVQQESRGRYADDGAADVWPSFAEVLAAPGEDCDGLELLAYHALRALGFPSQELYRAILRHPSRDAHHMVTLWFETPDDPWVIDPTAAVTAPLRRMSQIPDWVPVKVFSETAEYSVGSGRAAPAASPPAARP